MDVKDILGVGKGDGGPPAPKEKAPKPVKMKRPEGMSREAFALLGDQHPILSSQLAVKKKDIKAKPKPSTKGIPVWLYKTFSNSARTDGLELSHWTRAFKDASGRIKEAEDSEYSFAKYNKRAQMCHYTHEEYETFLKHDSGDWSRSETDYLFALCEQFDLRFHVIADRYEFPGGPKRALDDLKGRYYGIARKLLVSREGHEAGVANNTLVRHPFNAQHEKDRKAAVMDLLKRNPAQTQEDNAILNEAKAIEDKRRADAQAAAGAAAAARRAAAAAAGMATPAGGLARNGSPAPAAAMGMAGAEVSPSRAYPALQLQHPAEFSNQVPPGTPSLFDQNVAPWKPPTAGVYARGASALTAAMAMANSIPGGMRGFKPVEATLQDLGWPGALTGPRVPTRATCGAFLALRAEAIAYHELRRQLHARAGIPDAMAADGQKQRGRAAAGKRR